MDNLEERSEYPVRIRERMPSNACRAEVPAGILGIALEEYNQPPEDPSLVTVRVEAKDLGYEVSDPDDDDDWYMHLYVPRSNIEIVT